MANPLFNALGGNGHQNGNMLSQFQQFMGQMKGKNPNEILNNLVSSGQVSQSQLNKVQAQAKQMQSSFSNMKSMFGF